MTAALSFFNLYRQGFVRVGAANYAVKVADPEHHAEQVIGLLHEAVERKTLLTVFPELGLSAYSCDDLFHQQALLDASRAALARILDATRDLAVIGIVGLPLQVDHLLFNCAAVFCQGKLLGVVPKTYLPNYREFYELRQFNPGDAAVSQTVTLCGQADVPFGNRLLFRVEGTARFTFAVEICEDLWVPIPPSTYAALAGATVLLNLSASNITTAKADYRRQLVTDQSARCIAGYIYSAAAPGESTTDLAWDGHCMIYENGMRLAESQRFHYGRQLVVADLDLDRLSQDRMRMNSFGQSVQHYREVARGFRTVPVSIDVATEGRLLLANPPGRFPYVPADPSQRDRRCAEVCEIQVNGLVKRLQAANIDKIVIGISGGLDSTQALLVCAQAMDVLKLPRTNILAYTLPGFATTERTLGQARRLMAALGCTTGEIDIRPSCLQMLRDIDHPAARGEEVYDVTYENVQAGERTSHLFRLANHRGGMVVGTSDLSELALGWCTYGVGDHMAHYHVNASVPKTLIQYLIAWIADTDRFGPEASAVLRDVLATRITPELAPGQGSEEVIGPYELQDFHLYYTLRFGYLPTKVAFLAYNAWHDRTLGAWPEGRPEQREYTIGEIKHWLGVFLDRFFRLSQYKRSCIPNSPKVGSGGALSPRGDYRAPSDSEARVWLADLQQVPDRED